MINSHQRFLRLATLPALLLSSLAFGSGIQLDTSYSSAGYAWAGRAATYDDASTGYYNPALYSAFSHPQVGFSTIFVDVNPDVKILAGNINATGIGFGNIAITGNDRASIGGWNVLGGLHAVLPLPYRFSLGLNVAMPWGLTFDYPQSSKSRYFGQHASLKVVDIDPGISFEVFKGFSVGVALDATYANAETKLLIPTIISKDTTVNNENGDNWAFGWNAGVLYRAPTHTSIGAGYHSKISTTTDGPSSAIDGVTNTEYTGRTATHFIFPAFFNVSIVQDLSPCWSILADIRFTNWSKVSKNTIKFSGDIATEVADVDLPLNWIDSLNYAVGISYKPSEDWKLKGGFGYDISPVRNDELRPFLIPDNDRYVIGLGAQYHVSKNVHFDAGYTLKLLPRSEIQATLAPTAPPIVITTEGKVDTRINELTLSLNWTFS